MKTKTNTKVIKTGELAVWVDFDGRYSTNETIVRVVDFNSDADEYLVKLEDKSWKVLGKSELRPLGI